MRTRWYWLVGLAAPSLIASGVIAYDLTRPPPKGLAVVVNSAIRFVAMQAGEMPADLAVARPEIQRRLARAFVAFNRVGESTWVVTVRHKYCFIERHAYIHLRRMRDSTGTVTHYSPKFSGAPTAEWPE